MKKYKITHKITADFIAEVIVNEDEIDTEINDLKEYKKPFLEEAASNGIPVVRPLFLEFPDDKNTYSIDSQFMLGDSLMMAPMLKSKNSRRVYFPKGKWFSVYSEKIWFSKGETFKVEAPLGKPAVFVKESFPEETLIQLREL